MRLRYVRHEDRMYALNDEGNVMYDWECRHDFVPGYNSYGQARASLPAGVYPHCWAEEPGDWCKENNGVPYGTFYIHTGDYRGRDIHGGGSGLSDPFARRQGWIPTYGCLRMQNEDGEELSRIMMMENGDVSLEVVE